METHDLQFPSAASLYLSFCFNGRELATGMGFIIKTAKGAYLITNRHNG